MTGDVAIFIVDYGVNSLPVNFHVSLTHDTSNDFDEQSQTLLDFPLTL